MSPHNLFQGILHTIRENYDRSSELTLREQYSVPLGVIMSEI